MATQLKNLKLNRVDLVDAGANPEAHIMLIKRKGESYMTLEEFLKSLTDEQRSLVTKAVDEAVKKSIAEAVTPLQADLAKAKETVAAKDAEILQKDSKIAELQKTSGSPTEEELMKNVDPAIRAIVEKARQDALDATAKALRLEDENLTKQYVEVAKTYTSLPIQANTFGPVLKKLAKSDPDGYKAIESLLKAANEAIAKGKLFEAVGKGFQSSGAESAWNAIQVKADELVKNSNSTPKISKEAAIRKVMMDNPELYKQYREEQEGGNS